MGAFLRHLQTVGPETPRRSATEADCHVHGPIPFGPRRCTVANMWTVLIILLVIWAVLSVVGFAIKGLIWLAVIGLILFVGTIIFGMIRNAARRK